MPPPRMVPACANGHKRKPWSGKERDGRTRSGFACVACSKTWEYVGDVLRPTYPSGADDVTAERREARRCLMCKQEIEPEGRVRECFDCKRSIKLHDKWTWARRHGILTCVHRNCDDPTSYIGAPHG